MKVEVINDCPVMIWTDEVEDSAMEQIVHLTTLPFLFHHLVMMPDVHTGKGMPIGGVLACTDAVVPNAVGVDIGCGMCAVKTNLKVSSISADVMRKKVMRGIRRRIPLGKEHHKQAQDAALLPQGHDIDSMTIVRQRQESILKELGTLGGGNHFIELQRDEDDNLWIMIHSGSRNLGARVGTYYNQLAEHLNARWHSAIDPAIHMAFLPKGENDFTRYWDEMRYCIDFALCNRQLMMHRIEEVLVDTFGADVSFDPMINIAHNYAAFERHFGHEVIVHRKGATLATEGMVGIIPGSQGTASYIVEGLGNELSFKSCSHGAGRKMSRTLAEQTLNMAEEVNRLESQGIIHDIRSQNDMQEASGAYKNIEEVINNELDLVRIRTRLLPVAVIKG